MDIKGTTTSMSGSHHVGDHILSAIDQETVRQFEIVQLVVAPLNKKRKLYQTWHIDQNGLLVNDAKFCVQIVRTNPASFETGRCDLNEFVGTAALAAKPRPSATHLISSTISPAIIAPLWLRPGSGCLRVFLYLDGVTRVLRIEDAADPSSLLDPSDLPSTANVPEQLNPARWGNPLFIERFWKRSNATTPWLNRQLSNSSLNVAPHFKALIALPCGIGVSVISAFAEELIYASLLNIHMSFSRVPAPDIRASDSGLDYSGGLKGLNLASDVLLQHGSSAEKKGMNAGETNPSGSETSSVRSPAESTEWDFGFTDFRSATSRSYLAESLELIVGHIQVDSQFPGAMFPVLLFTDHFDSENPISPPHHQQQQYKPQQQQQKFSAPDQRSSTSTRRSAQIGQTVSSSSNSVSWRPTLVARFEREVQTRWNVYLFKRMRIRISPIVIEAEELLLLKLIQFWQHVTDPIAKMGLANPATDESIYPRSNTGSVVDNGALFWFDRFSVSPIIIRLSVQTAKNSLTSSNLAGAKRLLPSLMSFTNADVQLADIPIRESPSLAGAVDRVHALESLSCLLEQLNSHYHMQLMANAVHIFGSVDFLGNPIGFINDLTSGISGLVDLDVGSLIRHVAHGVGDSTAKVSLFCLYLSVRIVQWSLI
ncbi:hypothetical protein FGIG_09475 [Fasciola gigantica]|uniref:Uncharacterized protein n=1 Tax=Fasciola gigantica TaxID=46835 RepID=A0A504Z5X3_FASGI|nr:hypothetical protein FGIG_09475 [Fasciola gigantica]